MKKAKLDTQGRIVIPKPFRKEMNIGEGSPLVITYEDGAVVVRADESSCRLCGSPIEAKSSPRLCDKCVGEVLEYYLRGKKNNDAIGKHSGHIVAEAINEMCRK